MAKGTIPIRHIVCAAGLLFWVGLSVWLLVAQAQRGVRHLPPYHSGKDQMNTVIPALVLWGDLLAGGVWFLALRRAAKAKVMASRGWAVWGWYGPPLVKMVLLPAAWGFFYLVG